MSLMIILILSLIPFALLEVIFNKSEWSRELVYKMAFALAFFIVLIKYYYGSDISIYLPLYNRIGRIGIFSSSYFEPGFLLFLKCCNWLHLSFWAMTAVITIVYFYALWQLFKQIPNYRVFGLLVLVVLDYNLLFFELRQCLAVSFFILAFLSYNNKQVYKTVLYLLLMAISHKSGIFIVGLFLFVLSIRNFKVTAYVYGIAIAVMFVFILFPIEKLIVLLLQSFGNSSAIKSIVHHLLVADSVQAIYVVYVLLSVLLFLITRKAASTSFTARFVFVAFAMVVLLVKYWFLLNRVRSYFIPIFLFYILCNLDKIEEKICKQLSYGIFTMYICLISFVLYRKVEQSISGVNAPQTVFSLVHRSKSEIIKDTLNKCRIFWKKEYVFEN